MVRAFERDCDRKPPQPGAVELAGSALAQEIRPLLRAVEENRGRYSIEYRLPPGGEVRQAGLPVAEDTEMFYDRVPLAPGLEPPITGATYQAFFHLVGAAGRRKSVSISLPRRRAAPYRHPERQRLFSRRVAPVVHCTAFSTGLALGSPDGNLQPLTGAFSLE